MRRMLLATVSAAFCGLIGLCLPNCYGSPNLLTNGDFSAGNTGFGSEYGYMAVLPPPTETTWGKYAIVANPDAFQQGWGDFGDHTSGSGLMLLVDGSGYANAFWEQAVPVVPGTRYNFDAWVANIYGSWAPVATIAFQINGDQVSAYTVPSAGGWSHIQFGWDSGTSNGADIRLVNSSTALIGSDFVLDDLSFASVPEPTLLGVLASPAIGLLAVRRRKPK